MQDNQGTKAWMEARRAEFTGSEIWDLCRSRVEKKAESSRKGDILQFLQDNDPKGLEALRVKYDVLTADKLTVAQIQPLYDATPGKLVFPEGFTAGQLSYIRKKATQVVNPVEEPELRTDAIIWGETYEAEMFEVVSKEFGVDLETPPFLLSVCKNFGSSADRVDPKNRLVFEGKCPFTPSNYMKACLYDLDTFRQDNPKYYYQCQAHIAVTGFECFFINYDPRVTNPKKRLSVLHVPKDDEVQEEMRYWSEKGTQMKFEMVKQFLAKKGDVEKLRSYVSK